MCGSRFVRITVSNFITSKLSITLSQCVPLGKSCPARFRYNMLRPFENGAAQNGTNQSQLSFSLLINFLFANVCYLLSNNNPFNAPGGHGSIRWIMIWTLTVKVKLQNLSTVEKFASTSKEAT